MKRWSLDGSRVHVHWPMPGAGNGAWPAVSGCTRYRCGASGESDAGEMQAGIADQGGYTRAGTLTL